MRVFQPPSPVPAGSHPFNWSVAHRLDWNEGDGGRMICSDPRFWIDSTGTMSWLRRLGYSREPMTLWIGAPSECMAMAGLFAAHQDAVETLIKERTPLRLERESPIPGIRAIVDFNALTGGSYLDHQGAVGPSISLRNSRNSLVGSLSTVFTPAIASYAVGDLTINGSSWIDREFVGRGLGRFMYDLAEEVAGVPLVPHGVNLVHGDRSELSIRFWERRAQHRRVPGLDGDPAVEERLAQARKVQEHIKLEERYHMDAHFAAAVSANTGWPVEIIRHNERYSGGWCVAPDGRVFTSRGFEDPETWLRGGARSRETATREGLLEASQKETSTLFGLESSASSREAATFAQFMMTAHGLLEARAGHEAEPEGESPDHDEDCRSPRF